MALQGPRESREGNRRDVYKVSELSPEIYVYIYIVLYIQYTYLSLSLSLLRFDSFFGGVLGHGFT